MSQCSTPFGINERFTIGHQRCRIHRQVLNAFRHQRTIHPHPPKPAKPSLIGAQRLSASTNDSRVTTRGVLRLRSGAQRLSASTNDSQVVDMLANCLATKCSTPFGINERFTRRRCAVRGKSLLSSSRCSRIGAQRLSASTNDSHRSIPCCARIQARCSTPFGINERFTKPNPKPDVPPPPRAQRLSASTNDSPELFGKHHASVACSTPFGINERFTRPARREEDHARPCSTPFGNERFTPPLRSAHVRLQVLNAFRHQRTIHLVLMFTLPAHSSAQRLSASTNDSPHPHQMRLGSG